MKKMLCMMSLAVALVVASGCVGGNNGFVLTQKLYKWNTSEIDNKWAQEGVFLAFNIVPVYGICVFVDAIVLNSFDFWTGSNPLASTTIEVDGQMVSLEKQSDGSLVAVSGKGTYRCVRSGEHVYAYDMEGRVYQVM